MIMMGFSNIVSIYVSAATTFSSTIIVMKVLSDKEETESLHGKIAIGMLIVQDVIAMILLMIISATNNVSSLSALASTTLVNGFIVALIMIIISVLIFPRIMHFIAASQELLFLFSIGWCLSSSILLYYFGFTFEIGALLAGITLAISPYSIQINAKMKPLRDFFVIIFFILLGSNLIFNNMSAYIVPIIVISLYILIGNPLIVMIIMGLRGYSSKTSFLTGISIAQVSEFSVILITLGVSYGHLSNQILSFVTMVGLITIAISSYMMTYSNNIYHFFSRYLKVFEFTNKGEVQISQSKSYPVIIFGNNRMGYDIINSLNQKSIDFLIVDYNPKIIKELHAKGINAIYGDAQDGEFLNELKLEHTKLIISTIPDIDTNISIIEHTKSKSKNIAIISSGNTISEAITLYQKGADYVIMPKIIAGERVAEFIQKDGTNVEKYNFEQKKHLSYLKKRQIESKS